MLNYIEDIFETAANTTGLVNKFGGVVTPVTMQRPNSNGQTVTKTFPVSCTALNNCRDTGQLQPIVPDQSFAGLAYVEQRGSVTTDYRDGHFVLTYPVRFVVWVNAAYHGLTKCDDLIANVELNVMNCLRTEKFANPDWIECGATGKKVSAQIGGIVLTPKNPGTIFQGYSYQDEPALYFWPYAYTAMDMTVRFLVPANCITKITTPTPVTCTTY